MAKEKEKIKDIILTSNIKEKKDEDIILTSNIRGIEPSEENTVTEKMVKESQKKSDNNNNF